MTLSLSFDVQMLIQAAVSEGRVSPSQLAELLRWIEMMPSNEWQPAPVHLWTPGAYQSGPLMVLKVFAMTDDDE